MSLRTRLFAALGIIIVVLVVAGAFIANIQHGFFISQIDADLHQNMATANRAASPTLQNTTPTRSAKLIDAYVGIYSPGGLRTWFSASTDPGVTPIIDGRLIAGVPTTVATSGGSGQQMRVMAQNRRDGTQAILGYSLKGAEVATQRLTRTLFAVGLAVLIILTLVFWWVSRLGIDPIRRVTKVAQAVRAGDKSQRVEQFPAGTEAQELGHAFNQLVDTNVANEALLRQFVADASHELRTPLTTLKGYASLYAAGGLQDPEAIDDAMRRISGEATRMSKLVDDLLLLANIDRAQSLVTTTVDVVPIVADLASDLRVIDADRQITVTAPDAAYIEADRDRVMQAIAVLTSNALRHTPAGSPIALRVRLTPSWVRVEVADQGAGISTADQAHVFDRFYRVDAGRGRSTGGSGLGLSIAAAIVRAHGGRYGVMSEQGRGSTFWLEFPVVRPVPQSAPVSGEYAKIQ